MDNKHSRGRDISDKTLNTRAESANLFHNQTQTAAKAPRRS